MPFTIEQTAQLEDLRRRVLANTATDDEVRAGIMLLRQDRIAAQSSSTRSRTAKTATAAPIDTTAILGALKAKAGKLLEGPV